MKIYDDIVKARRKVTSSINKYGFSPDHNYYNYLYTQNTGKKCIFFDFGQAKGVIAFYNKRNSIWRVINGIFAPKADRMTVLKDFIDWAFKKKKSRKIFIESSEDFKVEVFKKLKNSYKFNVNYLLHWPVYDLSNLDGKLSGKKWKKLRNINNRFFKSFKVEIKNPRRVNSDILKNILFGWTRRRYPRDRANFDYYVNAINNKFMGFSVLRAISLNGEVCSFSGGWVVPNSKIFYCGVGIFNYKHKDLGDFVNLDDLLHLKKLGYKYVDFGGSEKSLLHFKKKFGPARIYKTYVFSVSRKK